MGGLVGEKVRRGGGMYTLVLRGIVGEERVDRVNAGII